MEFLGEPFNEEEQSAFEEVRSFVEEHLEDPMVERLRYALLLALQSMKGLAAHAQQLQEHLEEHHEVLNEQGKRIEFLEQMLLNPEVES